MSYHQKGDNFYNNIDSLSGNRESSTGYMMAGPSYDPRYERYNPATSYEELRYRDPSIGDPRYEDLRSIEPHFKSAARGPGAMAYEGVTREPGAMAYEGVARKPGTMAYEGVTRKPGTMAYEGVTREPGTVGYESVARGPGTMAYEGVTREPGTVGYESVARGPGSMDHRFEDPQYTDPRNSRQGPPRDPRNVGQSYLDPRSIGHLNRGYLDDDPAPDYGTSPQPANNPQIHNSGAPVEPNNFGNDFGYAESEEDDQASVTTLDPTSDPGRNGVRIRKRLTMHAAAEMWNTIRKSTHDGTYTGLPSRGSAIQRKTLSQRRQEHREINGLEIPDGNDDKRQRLISHQGKTGTGVYTLKRKSFYKLRLQGKEISAQLEVWASSLKVIEGHFGSAILAYFTFVRWLMFLNLFIGLLLFCVITIPYLVLQPGETFSQHVTAVNVSDPLTEVAVDCTSNYSQSVTNLVAQHSPTDYVLDFLQGTGFMERTVLFYGIYFNKTLNNFDAAGLLTDPFSVVYNMSLAYILATGFYFIVSFLLIVRHSAHGMKEGLLSQESSRTKYCNKVFSGWDYCITDQSNGKLKHRNLRKEIEADLFEQKMEEDKANRQTRDWVKLYLIRALINFFVLCVLVGALALIYLTNNWSLELQQSGTITGQFLVLLVQYLPSIAITFLNLIVPLLFDVMVRPEGYSPAFQIKITLARTVLLRLASIGILMISLYDQVVTTTQIGDAARRLNQEICSVAGGSNNGTTVSSLPICDNSNTTLIQRCGNRDFNKIKCWETYVGQQLYKLVLLDFFVVLSVTMFVEFPRKFLYRKLHDKSKLIKKLGTQQFDIPQNVLDIVYCQTLCWLGAFFSPLIPVISFLKCFIFFYLKKLTLLNNCDPPEKSFRSSRINSFFMTVLLISFIMASFPIGYIVGRIPPSQSCGPFRVYSYEEFHMFDTITNLVDTFSESARDFFYFFGSVVFYVPAIILLCLIIYCLWAVAQGYKKMSELLKKQLAMKGKDKQYLLQRVTEALKRG